MRFLHFRGLGFRVAYGFWASGIHELNFRCLSLGNRVLWYVATMRYLLGVSGLRNTSSSRLRV